VSGGVPVSRVVLRRADLAAIEEHARCALPREACGLLLGSGDAQRGFGVTRIIESENVAGNEANDRFEIDPALLLRTHRTLREATGANDATQSERILGVYHSHPGGRPEPSALDREHAAAPGYVWIIVALDSADSGAGRGGGTIEARAFLHVDGLEPARFAPLSLVLRGD